MSKNQSIKAWELPAFDTGEYEDCSFSMKGGGATLIVNLVDGRQHSIRFAKVRWHRFTTMYACDARLIDGAFFTLVREDDSPELRRQLQAEASINRPYTSLSHYRIFLNETGAHELLAESAELSWAA